MPVQPSFAATPTIQMPAPDAFDVGSTSDFGSGPLGFVNNIARSQYLFGDMWGLRSALARYGISFALQETARCWATSRAVRRGAWPMTG